MQGITRDVRKAARMIRQVNNLEPPKKVNTVNTRLMKFANEIIQKNIRISEGAWKLINLVFFIRADQEADVNRRRDEESSINAGIELSFHIFNSSELKRTLASTACRFYWERILSGGSNLNVNHWSRESHQVVYEIIKGDGRGNSLNILRQGKTANAASTLGGKGVKTRIHELQEVCGQNARYLEYFFAAGKRLADRRQANIFDVAGGDQPEIEDVLTTWVKQVNIALKRVMESQTEISKSAFEKIMTDSIKGIDANIFGRLNRRNLRKMVHSFTGRFLFSINKSEPEGETKAIPMYNLTTLVQSMQTQGVLYMREVLERTFQEMGASRKLGIKTGLLKEYHLKKIGQANEFAKVLLNEISIGKTQAGAAGSYSSGKELSKEYINNIFQKAVNLVFKEEDLGSAEAQIRQSVERMLVRVEHNGRLNEHDQKKFVREIERVVLVRQSQLYRSGAIWGNLQRNSIALVARETVLDTQRKIASYLVNKLEKEVDFQITTGFAQSVWEVLGKELRVLQNETKDQKGTDHQNIINAQGANDTGSPFDNIWKGKFDSKLVYKLERVIEPGRVNGKKQQKILIDSKALDGAISSTASEMIEEAIVELVRKTGNKVLQRIEQDAIRHVYVQPEKGTMTGLQKDVKNVIYRSLTKRIEHGFETFVNKGGITKCVGRKWNLNEEAVSLLVQKVCDEGIHKALAHSMDRIRNSMAVKLDRVIHQQFTEHFEQDRFLVLYQDLCKRLQDQALILIKKQNVQINIDTDTKITEATGVEYIRENALKTASRLKELFTSKDCYQWLEIIQDTAVAKEESLISSMPENEAFARNSQEMAARVMTEMESRMLKPSISSLSGRFTLKPMGNSTFFTEQSLIYLAEKMGITDQEFHSILRENMIRVRRIGQTAGQNEAARLEREIQKDVVHAIEESIVKLLHRNEMLIDRPGIIRQEMEVRSLSKSILIRNRITKLEEFQSLIKRRTEIGALGYINHDNNLFFSIAKEGQPGVEVGKSYGTHKIGYHSGEVAAVFEKSKMRNHMNIMPQAGRTEVEIAVKSGLKDFITENKQEVAPRMIHRTESSGISYEELESSVQQSFGKMNRRIVMENAKVITGKGVERISQRLSQNLAHLIVKRTQPSSGWEQKQQKDGMDSSDMRLLKVNRIREEYHGGNTTPLKYVEVAKEPKGYKPEEFVPKPRVKSLNVPVKARYSIEQNSGTVKDVMGNMDVNKLVDKVYNKIEERLKEERRRRGLG